MADIFRWVDPSDPTTVLLDMNSFPGFKLRSDIDFGEMDYEVQWLNSPPHPGGIQVGGYYPPSQMTFELRMEAADLDACLVLMRTMSDLLQKPGLIEFQDENMAFAVFIDTFPSPVPAYIRGGYVSGLQVNQARDPGVPFTVWRHPFFRAAQVELAPESVANTPGSRAFDVSNPGNMLSPLKLQINPTGALTTQVRLARRSGLTPAQITEFKSLCSFEVEGATPKVDTSVVAWTGASADSAMRTGFATTDGLVRRWRQEITITDTKSMAGLYRVYGTVAVAPGLTPGDAYTQFRFQLRWGVTDDNPVSFTNDSFVLDFADDPDGDVWVEVDFGYVEIPDGAEFLVLEGWCGRLDDEDGNNNGEIGWDTVTLMPADEQFITYSVPGLRAGAWAFDRWWGGDLVNLDGAGTREDSTRINDDAEIAQAPPTAGNQLDAGHYRVGAKVVMVNTDETAKTLCKLQVVEADTGNVRREVKFRTRKNRKKTKREKYVSFEVTSADVTASRRFKLRVIGSAGLNPDKHRIDVMWITQRFLRTISGTELVQADARTRESFVMDEATEVISFPVFPEGEPPVAPPGDSVWLISIGDVPDWGYANVDDREPLPEHVAARGASIVTTVFPMYSH